ncbi:MAG: AAA family ATPase [Hyphomonadaceae bacterium]
MKYVDKYAPHKFSAVIGQESAIAKIIVENKNGAREPLLFTGPHGTGKTTLARITAAAVNCRDLAPNGDPCGLCEPCEHLFEYGGFFLLDEINTARFGSKAHAEHYARLVGSRAFHGDRHVIFCDEANGFSREAADVLLKPMEAHHETLFIFATTRPSELTPAFRSRCVHIELGLLSSADLVSLGSLICANENVEATPEALAMLAAAARGHAREFVITLERIIHTFGNVSCETVARILGCEWTQGALASAAHLLRGRLDDALLALNAWPAEPSAQIERLCAAFHFLSVALLATPDAALRLHPEFAALDGDIRAKALDRFAAALASEPSPKQRALAVAEFWAKAKAATEAELTVRMMEFAHACNPLDARAPAPPPRPRDETTPPRNRLSLVKIGLDDETRTAGRAAAARARNFCNAASIMLQEYGLPFNVRWLIRYDEFGATTPKQRAGFFSRAVHEIGMRARDWSSPAFRLHWLAQHETTIDGKAETRLLMHLPDSGRIAGWAAERYAPNIGSWFADFGPRVWREPAAGRPLVGHWSLVRELCASIGPEVRAADGKGGRAPLVELLEVPPRAVTRACAERRTRSYSMSKTLSEGMRQRALDERMDFLSAFDDLQWALLSTGWELNERRDRIDERARRAAQEAEIRALNMDASLMRDSAIEKKLNALRNSWPRDPKKRVRTHWRPWWLTD